MVYDSLYEKLPTQTKKQIYTLLMVKGGHIYINFMNVQSQNNSCDYGVFAIAFATALCGGKRQEEISSKKEILLKHLLKCLGEENITQFQYKTMKKGLKGKMEERIDIYCKCRT